MIKSFKVRNHMAVRLAECPDVPRVMIIYGDAAVGKSTLLRALNMRIEGFVNYDHYDQNDVRTIYITPPVSDKGFGTLKAALYKIEMSRRNMLAKYYDKNGEFIPRDVIPDIYDPLKKFLDFFMPDLKFERADTDNSSGQGFRCIFKKKLENSVAYTATDTDDDNAKTQNYEEIDIDQLKREEKRILSVFIPLIERQVEKLIYKIETSNQKARSLIFLIDDIDHFPIQLQSKIMEYLRSLIDEGQCDGTQEKKTDFQFVIVTHSLHLMNSGVKGAEFFILNAPSQLKEDREEYNQLVKMVP
jgi:hypothetical protein